MNLRIFNHSTTSLALAGAFVFSLLSSDSNAQTTIAVAPAKLNVLYIGVDNPVSVAAGGATDDKVTLSLSGCDGAVEKTATGMYNVRVSSITDNCMLNVYVDGKLAGTSQFRVRNLPRPMATVGGFTSGSKVNAQVFKDQPGIAVYIKDSPYEAKYEVVGFTVKMLNNNGVPVSIDCQGSQFSQQAKESLQASIRPGDVVTIQNIIARDQSGKEMKIPALVYPIE